MKRLILGSAAVVLMLLLAVPGSYGQGYGGWGCPGMSGAWHGGQGGGWYCPWMGGGYRGSSGPATQQYAPGQTPGKPLTEDQAKNLVSQYLRNTHNPNLKLGSITSKDGVYEAKIVTKDGSLVDKIEVNKQTGWFRSGY